MYIYIYIYIYIVKDEIQCRGRMPPTPLEVVVEVLEEKGRFNLKAKQSSGGVVIFEFLPGGPFWGQN